MENQEIQAEEAVEEPTEKKRSGRVWSILVTIVLILVVCFFIYILVGPAIQSVYDQMMGGF